MAALLLDFEAAGGSVASAFRSLDADADGRVTAQELWDGLRAVPGDPFADLTRADAWRVAYQIDADRSGSIDVAELEDFARSYKSQYTPEKRPPKMEQTPDAKAAEALQRTAAATEASAQRLVEIMAACEATGARLATVFERLAGQEGFVTAADLRAGLSAVSVAGGDAERVVEAAAMDGSGRLGPAELEGIAKLHMAQKRAPPRPAMVPTHGRSASAPDTLALPRCWQLVVVLDGWRILITLCCRAR